MMKRRDFFKSAALGSAALVTGIPLITGAAKAASLSRKRFHPYCRWVNHESLDPYVDSDLFIYVNGELVVQSYYDGDSGDVGILAIGDYLEVYQMGDASYPWPTGGKSTLIIRDQMNSTPHTLYNNTATVWTAGVIDSYAAYITDDFIDIQCFTSV